jgi:halogenation protein CepH
MTSLQTDVVVVGGGPAGSTAATLLAKAGHRVMLLEREQHPRHQIGESLLPATIHGICRLLDVWDDVHDAGFVVKRGGTIRWGRRPEPFTVVFAGYAFQVERARFDALLFDNARRHEVDAREHFEVLEAIQQDGRTVGVKGRDANGTLVTIEAKYVVDASGHGSRLARGVGSRIYSRFFQNVAVYGYFTGATRLPPPNQGNIISAAFEHGWCWFIPLGENLTSVGAVVDRRHAAEIGVNRERALLGFIAQCPLLRDHLIDASRITDGRYGLVRVRKDWSYTTDALAQPGMVLVGDSACFVDPLLSSGVHLATYSAMLAARTVATILAGDVEEPACLQEFEFRYRREYQVWYDFLLSFFDMEQDWESYFWAARSLLKTSERANDAFVRLLANGRTTSAEFFGERTGIGKAVADLLGGAADSIEQRHDAGAFEQLPSVELHRLGRSDDSRALRSAGLIVARGGLRWVRPSPPASPERASINTLPSPPRA